MVVRRVGLTEAELLCRIEMVGSGRTELKITLTN